MCESSFPPLEGWGGESKHVAGTYYNNAGARPSSMGAARNLFVVLPSDIIETELVPHLGSADVVNLFYRVSKNVSRTYSRVALFQHVLMRTLIVLEPAGVWCSASFLSFLKTYTGSRVTIAARSLYSYPDSPQSECDARCARLVRVNFATDEGALFLRRVRTEALFFYSDHHVETLVHRNAWTRCCTSTVGVPAASAASVIACVSDMQCEHSFGVVRVRSAPIPQPNLGTLQLEFDTCVIENAEALEILQWPATCMPRRIRVLVLKPTYQWPVIVAAAVELIAALFPIADAIHINLRAAYEDADLSLFLSAIAKWKKPVWLTVCQSRIDWPNVLNPIAHLITRANSQEPAWQSVCPNLWDVFLDST